MLVNTLTGGAGQDVFGLVTGEGHQLILDYQVGQDLLQFEGNFSLENLDFVQQLADTEIYQQGTDDLLAILKAVTPEDLQIMDDSVVV
jgi:Ca2+-binding RTX toxin-like protein